MNESRRKYRHLRFSAWLLSVAMVIFSVDAFAQEKPWHIEPPNWWAGMTDSHLQLMLHGPEFGLYSVEVEGATELDSVIRTDNDSYLFLNLNVGPNPETLKIILTRKGSKRIVLAYDIIARNTESALRQGFGTNDVVYLLMPDRFSDADPTNNNIGGYLDTVDRNNPDARHGGDLQGIINHLDYIKDLGVTALWLTPFQENNMPKWSYHGYATTDFYQCDPRLGTNELYRDLVDSAHSIGLKVIMDVVLNHIGSEHWWIKDEPYHQWIHSWHAGKSNFKASVIPDPHASAYDQRALQNGWFDSHMPDLYLSRDLVANYLIQNTLWWIESAGIDGIRLDTQPYADKEMVAKWSKRINEEYPNFRIVGEVWMNEPSQVAYFFNNPYSSYKSGVSSVFDFPLEKALREAFVEKDDYWDHGLIKIYNILSEDFVYGESNPFLVTFLDNHDLGRYMHYVGNDPKLMKMGLAVLLTTRGIPMVYYGTELGLSGEDRQGHGYIRQEMAGGWPDHQSSAFTGDGLDSVQEALLDYTRFLLNWRKDNKAILNGALKHYIPEKEAYVYFRYTDQETVMVVVNNSQDEIYTLDTGRFWELLENHQSAIEIFTGQEFLLENIIVNPKAVGIFIVK